MLKKIGTKQIVPLIIAVICLIFLITGLSKFGFWNDAQKSPTPAFVPSIICVLLIAICLITVFTSLKDDGKAKYNKDEFLIILAIVAALVIGVFVMWLGVRFPTGAIYDMIVNH